MWGIYENFKHKIEYFQLNIVPMAFYMDIMLDFYNIK